MSWNPTTAQVIVLDTIANFIHIFIIFWSVYRWQLGCSSTIRPFEDLDYGTQRWKKNSIPKLLQSAIVDSSFQFFWLTKKILRTFMLFFHTWRDKNIHTTSCFILRRKNILWNSIWFIRTFQNCAHRVFCRFQTFYVVNVTCNRKSIMYFGRALLPESSTYHVTYGIWNKWFGAQFFFGLLHLPWFLQFSPSRFSLPHYTIQINIIR